MIAHSAAIHLWEKHWYITKIHWGILKSQSSCSPCTYVKIYLTSLWHFIKIGRAYRQDILPQISHTQQMSYDTKKQNSWSSHLQKCIKSSMKECLSVKLLILKIICRVEIVFQLFIFLSNPATLFRLTEDSFYCFFNFLIFSFFCFCNGAAFLV